METRTDKRLTWLFAGAFWVHRRMTRLLRAGLGVLRRIPVYGPRWVERAEAWFEPKDAEARRESRFRAAYVWSFVLHVFVFLGLPMLALIRGCQDPYYIPGGGVEEQVQVQVQVQEVVLEQLVFNPNSPISYYVPKLEDSEVLRQIEEETRQTYVAGQIGAGAGQGGGYAGGRDDATVRFIRLRYSGGNWNQSMGRGADNNFLDMFGRMTGFNVARQTEAIHATDLRAFPGGAVPPFVYLSGSGSINMSQREIDTLRWYLLEAGGMLFADHGGGNFDRSFRALLRNVLPNHTLVVIPNDDEIYREPFVFPEGSPPLWHHSGYRALGIRHQGRWIAFYHQGDMASAWMDGGSGASDLVRQQAFRMGVNVVHYAFKNNLRRTQQE